MPPSLLQHAVNRPHTAKSIVESSPSKERRIMPTVAVTRKIPDAALAPLNAAATVRLWPEDRPPSPQELAELLRGCDGALTMVNDTIDGALLDQAPGLKVISTFAVGYDNINVPEATARGVAVCN